MVTIYKMSDAHQESTRLIYNHYITHTNATPERNERSYDEHLKVVADFLSCFVACENGRVIGFSFIKPYAKGVASFDPTVEVGVYVDHSAVTRGVGTLLTSRVIEEAKCLHKHSIIAKIDVENDRSIKLFKRLGFQTVANLREIGYKNGKRVSVVYMQLMFPE